MTNYQQDAISNPKQKIKTFNAEDFDQPVILERRAIWASLLVWLILGMTTTAVAWAAWAKIDQVIPTTGKLEPKGSVVDVRVPSGGVVREIKVKGGDVVQKDQVLIALDPTAPQADVESLRQQRQSALKQKQELDDDSDIESLKKLKAVLVAENESYKAEVGVGNISGRKEVGTVQQRRLEASRAESESRVAAAELRIRELEQQLSQVIEQIPKAEAQEEIARDQLETALAQVPRSQEQFQKVEEQLPTAQEQLQKAYEQVETTKQQLEMSREALKLNEGTLDQLEPLVREGAIAELQYKRQQEAVIDKQAQVSRLENEIKAREADVLRIQSEIKAREVEVSRSKSEVGTRQMEASRVQSELVGRLEEVDRLKAEAEKLKVQIAQARQQAKNTSALTQEDPLTKIGENEKRIAETELQLTRAISEKQRARLENQNKQAQIEGQLTRAEHQLRYQEVRAPISGTVFELKPKSAGFVAREMDAEPILKIVPNSELEASVIIPNKDIALVLDALRKAKEEGKEGVPVEVNIEAIPSTEFGTIEGTLTSIGSDVLAPNQERPFYAFPATIKLNTQKFILQNKLLVGLQSGMAVNANIKIGKRSVLDIFINRMTNKTKSLETVK